MADSEECKSSGNVINSDETVNSVSEKKKKPIKPGIIYLNYIPRYMTVKRVREYFAEFGEVRRLFLKPERSKKQGKPSKFFSEGWIEFSRRKVAKRVAECLNGTQVGGRRHTPYYDALWSIKYLPKFRWDQLSEGKAFEKARKEQRMRAEISKVKREVDFYTQSVEKMKRLKKSKDVKQKGDLAEKPANSSQAFQTVHLSDENQSSDDRQSLLLRKVFGNI